MLSNNYENKWFLQNYMKGLLFFVFAHRKEINVIKKRHNVNCKFIIHCRRVTIFSDNLDWVDRSTIKEKRNFNYFINQKTILIKNDNQNMFSLKT